MLQEEVFPKYTQEKIHDLNHQSKSNLCLVIIFGVVYDLHQFAFDHPGGANVIMRQAGEILDDIVGDAMHGFTESGVQKLLARYKVGFFDDKASSSHPHCPQTCSNGWI